MSEKSTDTYPGTPPTRLEPDAIGVTQDAVIGMASSAPAAVVALTLASLATAGIVGFGLILMLVARLVLKSSFFQLSRESDPGVAAEPVS